MSNFNVGDYIRVTKSQSNMFGKTGFIVAPGVNKFAQVYYPTDIPHPTNKDPMMVRPGFGSFRAHLIEKVDISELPFNVTLTQGEAPGPESIPAHDLQIGQVGRVIAMDCPYYGEHLLRTYTDLISLDTPNATWNIKDTSSSPNFPVVVLPHGSKLILTTGA